MAEPLSLDDAKAQLRILDNEEDAVITAAIVDARGWIENYTGLILTRRTVVEALKEFGATLRAWPIVSIDSVAYLDADGTESTLAPTAFYAQIARRPALLSALSWPRRCAASTVEITMTAGFADPEDVTAYSPNLTRAMRLLVAGYFADRETGGLAGDVEVAAKRLCSNLRRRTL